jgi:hypothetical protein
MADPLHVAKLLELSAEDWKAWRIASNIKPDLRDAVLSDPHRDWALRGVVVSNLAQYDLSDADLCRATFRHANLRSASLRRANLTEANLRFANLCRADLTEANLDGAISHLQTATAPTSQEHSSGKPFSQEPTFTKRWVWTPPSMVGQASSTTVP